MKFLANLLFPEKNDNDVIGLSQLRKQEIVVNVQKEPDTDYETRLGWLNMVKELY